MCCSYESGDSVTDAMLSEKSISGLSMSTLIGCRSTILLSIFFGKCHISYHLIVILVAQLSLVAQLPLLFFTVLFTQLCAFFSDFWWGAPLKITEKCTKLSEKDSNLVFVLQLCFWVQGQEEQ